MFAILQRHGHGHAARTRPQCLHPSRRHRQRAPMLNLCCRVRWPWPFQACFCRKNTRIRFCAVLEPTMSSAKLRPRFGFVSPCLDAGALLAATDIDHRVRRRIVIACRALPRDLAQQHMCLTQRSCDTEAIFSNLIDERHARRFGALACDCKLACAACRQSYRQLTDAINKTDAFCLGGTRIGFAGQHQRHAGTNAGKSATARNGASETRMHSQV